MAPYSSTLTWKIPWTEEPGGLQSMGSQRVNSYLIKYLNVIPEMIKLIEESTATKLFDISMETIFGI